jgi:hypothetical protein
LGRNLTLGVDKTVDRTVDGRYNSAQCFVTLQVWQWSMGGGGTSYISYVSLTVEVNISAFPPCDVALNVAPATKSFSIAIPDVLAGHEAIPVFWLHAIPVLLSHIVATKWWL